MQQYADIYLLQSYSTCTVTAASGTGTATSLQRGPIGPRWREVAVPVLWPVPEAAVTVFSTSDDGCCDTQNMYSSFAVNKYLHTVASSWIFIHIAIEMLQLQQVSTLFGSSSRSAHPLYVQNTGFMQLK